MLRESSSCFSFSSSSSSSSYNPNRHLSLPSLSPLHSPVQEDLVPLPLRAVKSLGRLPTFHIAAIESTNSDYYASLDYHIATAFNTKPTSHRRTAKETKHWPFYRCTLCLHFLDPGLNPSIIPGEPGRVFCNSCYMWIYKVSLCWKCRRVVGRGDERVCFGWCWWHWECMGCLCCSVREIGS